MNSLCAFYVEGGGKSRAAARGYQDGPECDGWSESSQATSESAVTESRQCQGNVWPFRTPILPMKNPDHLLMIGVPRLPSVATVRGKDHRALRARLINHNPVNRSIALPECVAHGWPFPCQTATKLLAPVTHRTSSPNGVRVKTHLCGTVKEGAFALFYSPENVEGRNALA